MLMVLMVLVMLTDTDIILVTDTDSPMLIMDTITAKDLLSPPLPLNPYGLGHA